MPNCPLCDTTLAEHKDEPCLHAWVATLHGGWVREVRGYFEIVCSSDIVWLWDTIPDYTDPEIVWAILLDLAVSDGWFLQGVPFMGFTMWSIRDLFEVTEYGSGESIVQVKDSPELAVLKAWICMKSGQNKV